MNNSKNASAIHSVFVAIGTRLRGLSDVMQRTISSRAPRGLAPTKTSIHSQPSPATPVRTHHDVSVQVRPTSYSDLLVSDTFKVSIQFLPANGGGLNDSIAAGVGVDGGGSQTM